MRLLGWLLLFGGGLLGLLGVAAALFFIFTTGAIWLSGGKFTEGLGNLVIGVVVVAIALLLAFLAATGGGILLATTAN